MLKNSRETIKKKTFFFEQELDPKTIIGHLPVTLRKKLSRADENAIKQAFSLTMKEDEKRYEEKYLDRMLT